MKIEQRKWTAQTGWINTITNVLPASPQLVLVFGNSSLVSDSKYFDQIKSFYPDSHLLLCSTAGEIMNTTVSDNSLIVTAILLEKTSLKFGEANISTGEESQQAGGKLASQLPTDDLTHVMIFSDGLKINGTALVRGLRSKLPNSISVTGGLVGDGSNFKHTYVGLDKSAEEGKIIIVGFYGKSLKVGYGSLGGWDTFGPTRLITKSKDNILYELDHKPALKLYKEYLGDQAKGLPGTGLLFPLSLRLTTEENREIEVVRTLLAVDENTQSMTFAGDMPEGTYAKLMKANFDRLIDGASGAAKMSIQSSPASLPELAILISCIGRKLVLKERVEEELEAVSSIVGKQAAMTGFYSYGEICPTVPTEKQCQLHNQTMTITTFREE
ncbi:FIST C-terminal domain-containing protein [Candidatus Daviesbacteria bacterium]|nr:FIST C-terminal domain-containing protein [Candidatus Daviesbacteria bacterium]